jgi:hypothetical protein
VARGKSPRAPGLLADLERFAFAVVLAAAVATLLLVSRSDLVPDQRPLTFGLVFGLGFLALYAAVGLLPGAILLLLLHGRGLRRTAQLLVTLAITGFCALAGVFNWRALLRPMLLGEPGRLRFAVPSALLLSAAALLAAVVSPLLVRRGRLLLRLLSLAAIGATYAAIGPLPTRAEAPVVDVKPGAPTQRFLLIGIDGADWRYVDQLVARGELPNIAALKQRGAFGPLKTARPTLSPVIWTSIATGVPPGRHGITDFFSERIAGVAGPLPHLKPPHRLGYEMLDYCLRARRLLVQGSVGSDSRRVPAYWNIAAANRLPTVVANWWATWPAEPVLGVVVSDQFYFDRLVQKGRPPLASDLVFPGEVFAELDPLVILPTQLPIETARQYIDVTPAELERMKRRDESLRPALLREFNYYVASFETDRRVALRAIEHQQQIAPADALVLFRLIDKMGHAALEYSDLVENHLDHSQTELSRFGGVMSAAYRAVDAAVGDLMRTFGDGNVIIVSDHGFQLEGKRYFHDEAPDGVFLAAGPAFQPGAVQGLSIYDMLPLLLYLKDLPTAEDQRGKLPRAALNPSLIATQPERRIPSYGSQEALSVARRAGAIEAERLAELIAIGYIRRVEPNAKPTPAATPGK